MLTVVAISMEEMHWTITDIRSEIMVLIVDVSWMICEVSAPALVLGFSNQAISFLSMPAHARVGKI